MAISPILLNPEAALYATLNEHKFTYVSILKKDIIREYFDSFKVTLEDFMYQQLYIAIVVVLIMSLISYW
jgi:hypothetical protein